VAEEGVANARAHSAVDASPENRGKISAGLSKVGRLAVREMIFFQVLLQVWQRTATKTEGAVTLRLLRPLSTELRSSRSFPAQSGDTIVSLVKGVNRIRFVSLRISVHGCGWCAKLGEPVERPTRGKTASAGHLRSRRQVCGETRPD
jgi:hypothetical protein